MTREIDKIIHRIDQRIHLDRRFHGLANDMDAIKQYVERDQGRKDALLNDYLVMLHYLSASNMMPDNEKARRLLAALSYSIAQILGDYDYSLPGGMKKAKDLANRRSKSILQAMADKVGKEDAERKAFGRSNMGRSKTPTISRLKHQATLERKKDEGIR